MSEYPDRVTAEIDGQPVVLAARVADYELPTRAPGTTIEFSPDNPPLRNGDSITFTTISITD